jgi:hypothetical protein
MKVRKPTLAGAVLAGVILVLALALVPAAFAGKSGGGGGGHHGGGGGTTYTGSFVGANPLMVPGKDSNGNGLPNAGDTVTFSVASTAPYPFVKLTCSQHGAQVLQESEGFYSGWLWGTNFYLGGMVWTSGAANCTAVLYSVSYSGVTEPTEATMTFQVGA